ncbi:NAD(P)/FAD-dependent oxidoreductase [Prosthecomicrobium pneumaticum]|uniref:Glycine/D-amino acid oxidase-like deaminating enzyme n=1 Tax=Prosthecomicrobium pneumaticum TaxID=81895 RepID=A0A7W9L293_9HYPH|nr:FAD-binding oxidoreductase [Prosthecomicrobium pneumaticum]MBB5753324.1 glycine/D-amino acid oxidase-like deaminating enzyme [Prosthecomicrobium pneumaticum]
MTDPSSRYDVVIVGGAVHGASAAYHLAAHPGFSGRVLLVEKDPTFRFAATALSAGSIRQQFSSAVNIAISLEGIAFLRAIGTILEVEGDRPSIGLVEGGYLFLATPAGAAQLAENHRLQTALGADILHFDAPDLPAQFPWLSTEGLAAGAWGRSGEGWFDGYGLMQALRRKARALGVETVSAEVVAVEREGGRATGVRLADGARIAAGRVILAAGSGTAPLMAGLGLPLPVVPKKRMVFTFACRERLAGFPLLIDPTGVYCRPEGEGFIAGVAPDDLDGPPAEDFEVDHTLFEETIWPVLAARIPAFEAIRPGRAWAGHYDMNLFDHNAVVGPLPLAGLLVANGFSGHGLQQAPAVGRGLAELVVAGRYETLDLAELGYDRIAAGRKLLEKNVV